MSGLDAMIAIRTEFPQARIIILTTFESKTEVERALAQGACAYVLKSAHPKVWRKQSVEYTASNRIKSSAPATYISVTSGLIIVVKSPFHSLSPRKGILELLRGTCNAVECATQNERGDRVIPGGCLH
jgi:DNA-binding NarL/FixJ family response regulator